MTRSEPTIRAATHADAKAFYGKEPRSSFRGFVAEIDGHVIGIGGVYFDGRQPIAFSEMKPAMRQYRRSMVRACRILAHLFDQVGRTVYAVACKDEPTAANLLARLGFKPTGVFGPHGETLARG